MSTTKSILNSSSHITLAPISYNAEKEANINYHQEVFARQVSEDKGTPKALCWYGDRKSAAYVGEVFAFVHGFAKPVKENGEGEVEFYRIVAILGNECAPCTWVNAKEDKTRDILVLEPLNHTDTWCNVNELLGHARTHMNKGVERTPFLTGMSRRKTSK